MIKAYFYFDEEDPTTSDILTNSYSKNEVYYNRLKASDGAVSFTVPYNSTLAAYLKTSIDSDVFVQIKDGNTNLATGYLHKQVNFERTQRNQPIAITLDSPSFMLDQSFDQNYVFENKTVAYMIRFALNLAGIVDAYIGTLNLTTSIPFVSVSSGNSIREFISELCFEYQKVFYFDDDGVFQVSTILDTSNSYPATFNNNNILDKLVIQAKDHEADYVSGEWNKIELKTNTLLFSDTQNAEGSDKCRISIPAGEYVFGEEENLLTADSTFGEVVGISAITQKLITADTGITWTLDLADVDRPEQMRLVAQNTTGTEKFIRRLDIYGDAYINTGVVSEVSSTGLKVKDFGLKYIQDQSIARSLVEALANYYRFSNFTLSFKSKAVAPLGSFVSVTDSSGVYNGKVIQRRKYLNTDVIEYVVETIEAFEPAEIVQTKQTNKGTNAANNQSETGGTPVTPTSVVATARRDDIYCVCVLDSVAMKDTAATFQWELVTASGVTKTGQTSDSTFVYRFNRSTDGYPEATELDDSGLDNWKVRVKVRNVFGTWSAWSAWSFVDVTGYQTWKVPDITVQTEVLDRTAILTAIYEASNIYGTPHIKAKIKRLGNTDLIDGQTFNSYLGITPDGQFYTPDLSSNPYGDSESNTEGNYKADTTTAFEGNSNRFTQTLPLIGQTKRLFDSDNHFTGTFAYEAAEVSTLPENPEDGDIIKWNGADTTTLTKGSYYQYKSSDTSWHPLLAKTVIVPTAYQYQVSVTNESGNESNVETVTVTALCTNISDIVHSHEHYKDLYVEKLSAINANIGMISQGGMGSFEQLKNCWALSDLSAEDSGVAGGVMGGTFRVGDNNEYFRVTPYIDPTPQDPAHRSYKIELKAGNIELTTTSNGNLDFTKGTYVYNDTRTGRLALTPEGIYAQKLIYAEVTPVGTENPSVKGWYELVNDVYVKTLDQTVNQGKTYYEEQWDTVSMVIADQNGNMIISNDKSKNPAFGFQVNGDIYHFDNTLSPTDEEVGEGVTPSNPQNIQADGEVISTATDASVLIDSESSTGMFKGDVSKDISAYTGNIVFLNKAESIVLTPSQGDETLIHSYGTVTTEDLPDPLSGYNEAIKETSTVSGFSGTVGAYLGLSDTQVSKGIFN